MVKTEMHMEKYQQYQTLEFTDNLLKLSDEDFFTTIMNLPYKTLVATDDYNRLLARLGQIQQQNKITMRDFELSRRKFLTDEDVVSFFPDLLDHSTCLTGKDFISEIVAIDFPADIGREEVKEVVKRLEAFHQKGEISSADIQRCQEKMKYLQSLESHTLHPNTQVIDTHNNRHPSFLKMCLGFFSCSGRVSRVLYRQFCAYFLGGTLLLGAWLYPYVSAFLIRLGIQSLIYSWLVLCLVCVGIICWCVFATSIRRLHDLNKSGWWLFLPFVLACFAFKGVIVFSFTGLTEEAMNNHLIELLSSIFGFVVWVIILSVLGSKVGDPNANKYGEKPLR